MADKIQLTLENMIPELEYFVQEGIFKKNEVKNIIKKRRFYEYQFEKKDITKLEYYKAIRYERILERRRLTKRKELNTKKNNFYDFHFLRRIVFLYKKCITKFKKDNSIWMEFFNFLIKHKCHNIINREIGSCLVNNPYNLDFWRIAAYNEYESNSNFLAARNIFQKCLRINRKNIEAHLDYFDFELKFGDSNQEKVQFITEKENEIVIEEKEIMIEEKGDDITQLKIPELIWLRALKDTNFDRINGDLKFLSVLMKNSKNLICKRLKNVLIDDIRNQTNQPSVEIEMKILDSKLEKYDQKDFLKKSIDKYLKLIQLNKEKSNLIISHLLNLLQSKNKDLMDDESKKEKINDYIISSISSFINQNELIENGFLEHNHHITKFIYEDSYFRGQQNKKLFDLDNIIEKIIENISKINSSLNNFEILVNSYFTIYWKFRIYNLNENTDLVINKLIQSFFTNNKSNIKVKKSLILNLISLIQEEVKVFPDRISEYVNVVLNFIKNSKIMDLDLVKEFFAKIVEMLFNLILQDVPKNEILFSNSSYLKNINQDVIKSLTVTKNAMKGYLINYDAIKRDLFNKMTKQNINDNEKQVLKMI